MTPNEVLGVAQDATPEAIKAAYRKLVMKHHPDRNGSTPESVAKFQEIQLAYETLTKPKPQSRPQGNPFGGFASWAFDDHVWEQARVNADYQTQAGITLEQAYSGTELSITLQGDRIITVKVPKGVQHGQVMKVAGEGSREHADLPPGNLHVVIFIVPHPVFQFNGSDLGMVVKIDALDLLTGTEYQLTTIGGENLSVNIPRGSNAKSQLRVPNKGMPQGNGFGHLYLVIEPVFPVLSDEQVEAIKKIKTA